MVLDGVAGAALRLECWGCFPGCLGGWKSSTDGERSWTGAGTIRSGEENLPDKVVGEETVEVAGEETVEVVVEVLSQPM